ncbi:MAG: hypothetical protein ABIV11_00450, partial [Gemmatimonadaceae bacterium]
MKLNMIGLALILVLGACASPGFVPPLRGDPSLITEEEIVASLAVDAHDAITKLRSNFLASRGRTSFLSSGSSLPTVFVDDMEYGPISTLAQIPASSIMEIRLLRSWEATTIYG